MVKVFLSYAEEDNDFASKLSSDLRSIDYEVAQYTINFPPGVDIKKEITSRIDESNVFIPVLSPNALQSKWVCEFELPLARRLQARKPSFRVIPVLLSGSVASLPQLQNITHVDFTNAERYARSLARLVAALPRPGYDELFQLKKDLDSLSVEKQSLLVLLKKAARKRVVGRAFRG